MSFTDKFLGRNYSPRVCDNRLTGFHIGGKPMSPEKLRALIVTMHRVLWDGYMLSQAKTIIWQGYDPNNIPEWIPYPDPDYYKIDVEVDPNPVNEKCECGSGSDDISGAHSHWCRRYLAP